MNFSEFLEQVQKLQCQERRTQTESYVEVVVAKLYWPDMDQVLQSFFGAPLKPQGQRPSSESDRCAKPYGGVRKDQALYFKKSDNDSYAALLWPWGSGTAVTLKIIKS